jgi:DNA (cytosine-5)-methyltransferase 1
MGAARKLFVAADLFCGGGGFSRGFALACEDLGIHNVRLIAINHWRAAVETHAKNHPWAEHHCARVEQLDPRKLVPDGRMKILIASPECTNHANARGGRPINDQSRATAWDVVKWAQEIYIENILIENVREIMNWGPLGSDGQALKSRKGEIFRQWIESIRACGYNLEHRILNSADFGGATTRQRFFLVARRTPHRVVWPEPTHSKDAIRTGDLFRGLKPWRAAREVIDWSLKGQSIFSRKKPLAANTLARIEAGLRKFGGAAAEPFIVLLRGTSKEQIEGSARSTAEPLATITAGGIHAGLVDPFIITPGGADLPGGRSVKDPLPTVLCHERFALVEPFVLPPEGIYRGNAPRSIKDPLQTITASRGGGHLVQPFVVQVSHGGKNKNGGRVRSVDQPLGTITKENGHALVEPFIVSAGGPEGQGRNAKSVEEPLGTVMLHDHKALVQPFLVKYNGTARANSIDKPVPTATAVARLGLVQPQAQGVLVDILFRMLEPHELARAMGFEGYEFTGTKKDRIKMIGNAVSVELARALCAAILRA